MFEKLVHLGLFVFSVYIIYIYSNYYQTILEK